ncbi:uncharacterized protein [Anabrus simplex]|uniref:uncharacterized protein isoform X2 n=1 Tax=Anabrus simplex TaxID=316456 RepID=UPI0035A39FAB
MADEGLKIPSWIDKDFVQKALREGERDSSLTVTSFEIKPANAAGDGYSSDMFRLTAKLSDTQERQMIIKCHPQGGLREVLMKNMNTFNKESRMFTETLAMMNRLLQRALPGEYQPLTAKLLYHGNNPLTFLVLEDLRPSGFVMANRQQGLDLAHCSLIMKKLAQFHAASVALHEQNPSTLEYYSESGFREQSKAQLEAFLINTLTLLAKEVSTWKGYEKYVSKLENMKNNFTDRLIQTCKRKEDEFNVLIHGDFWTNNMLFRYSGNTVKDIRFVDLQLVHYTSFALDLHYFFYTSPSDEVRVSHMDRLIEEYHTNLTDTLRILGCSRKISLSQLQRTFKEYAIYGLFAAVGVMPIVLSDPEHGFDIEKSLTVSDSAQANRGLFSNERYVRIMKRLLPIFEENDVL